MVITRGSNCRRRDERMKSAHSDRRGIQAERGIGFLITTVLLMAVSGCGSDPSTVTGKVTMDGEPLPDAFIEFVPASGSGSVSYGKTNSEGYYEMRLSREEAGASPGENQVKITTADVRSSRGREVTFKERVPIRYNSQTELIRTVEPGENLFDFELTSEGETDQSALEVES